MINSSSVENVVHKGTKQKETAMSATQAFAKAAGNFRCYMSAMFQPSEIDGVFLPDREMAQWLVNQSQGERELKRG